MSSAMHPSLHQIWIGTTIGKQLILIRQEAVFILLQWVYQRFTFLFISGISLVTEKGVLTTSRLLVQKAVQSDSGLYTCTPSNANPVSVRVC